MTANIENWNETSNRWSRTYARSKKDRRSRTRPFPLSPERTRPGRGPGEGSLWDSGWTIRSRNCAASTNACGNSRSRTKKTRRSSSRRSRAWTSVPLSDYGSGGDPVGGTDAVPDLPDVCGTGGRRRGRRRAVPPAGQDGGVPPGPRARGRRGRRRSRQGPHVNTGRGRSRGAGSTGGQPLLLDQSTGRSPFRETLRQGPRGVGNGSECSHYRKNRKRSRRAERTRRRRWRGESTRFRRRSKKKTKSSGHKTPLLLRVSVGRSSGRGRDRGP